MISNSIKKLTVVCFFTLFANLSFAQTNAERAQTFNLEKNLAIQGYDPVAYFSQNEAAKGKKSIATTFQGVIYYFSTEKNKQTFLKNPAQYEPQYGGWCAFALGSYGEKVEIDPETFKIIDGKLYLFYNAYFNNTLKTWNKDESNLKRKADLNWQKLTKTNKTN